MVNILVSSRNRQSQRSRNVPFSTMMISVVGTLLVVGVLGMIGLNNSNARFNTMQLQSALESLQNIEPSQNIESSVLSSGSVPPHSLTSSSSVVPSYLVKPLSCSQYLQQVHRPIRFTLRIPTTETNTTIPVSWIQSLPFTCLFIKRRLILCHGRPLR
jgi:hypothetical protein